MNNSYIKQNRIATLWKYYLLNGANYEDTYQRALQMGVSNSTAKGYMDIILARINKINSNNK